MSVREYFKTLNRKLKIADKKAKNPFLERSFAYNPFISAIEQTYIWIERKKNINCTKPNSSYKNQKR